MHIFTKNFKIALAKIIHEYLMSGAEWKWMPRGGDDEMQFEAHDMLKIQLLSMK